MGIRDDKKLRELLQDLIEERYDTTPCEECGTDMKVFSIDFDVDLLKQGSAIVGDAWFRCPVCDEYETSDMYLWRIGVPQSENG